MNIVNSLEKLFSLHTFGVKLGLDNIKEFLKHIGNPQNSLKVFHIAGSNGKGSVAAFISSILQEFDFKVGLYTSPHFVRFNERIKINGKEIPDFYVADFTDKHWDYIEDNKLTFFEVTTAMAFQYFADNNVEYAVIETGLGGRLDATNVIDNPLAVIITSISLEHTNILGNEIEGIAKEKAAIIKLNSKVFTGILNNISINVVKNKCEETNSELYKIEDYSIIKDNTLELYSEELEFDDWTMPLKGDYQKYNAAIAALAVTKTLILNNLHSINKGIENVIKNTGIQGRYEFYSKSPDIIFDSAHNPDGLKNFLDEFKKDYKKYSRKVVLFGAMRDKSLVEIFNMLNENFDEIHLTTINYERAATIEELKNITSKNNINTFEETDPVKFIENFKKRNKEECLVVLGSMYLLGDIKSKLTVVESA